LAKATSAYFCKNCGHETPKWMGKCPACNEWNTMIEEPIKKGPSKSFSRERSIEKPKAISINDIGQYEQVRIVLKDQELNRVLGGGLVPGSLVLFGGEPGVGKSTLMLQVALAQKGLRTLYVSGEESEEQIKMRAERIGIDNDVCFILAETSLEDIFPVINEVKPSLIIIDSIQTLFSSKVESAPGSITQVRECAADLLRYAKESAVPICLIGHITKDGAIAGPKILEHMVDTVLQFEGERNFSYRLLRSTKNRFGSTNELGIYEMSNSGLRAISDPSEILITHRSYPVSGVAIGCSLEGNRPLLIEVQALVSTAAYGTPQRTATGFDLRRLSMLLAVLEKRCGFRLGIKDVFINITGGVKIDDPGLDLAVACAILSSNEDIPLREGICFAAEIGLTGEVRPVNRIEQRIAEAERLGYKEIFVSGFLKKSEKKPEKILVNRHNKIEEVLSNLFG